MRCFYKNCGTKQDHTPINRTDDHIRPLPSLLSSGLLTAHHPYHLMLLGSPPDMVHEEQLRKARTSTQNRHNSYMVIGPQNRNPSLLQRISGSGRRYCPDWCDLALYRKCLLFTFIVCYYSILYVKNQGVFGCVFKMAGVSGDSQSSPYENSCVYTDSLLKIVTSTKINSVLEF